VGRIVTSDLDNNTNGRVPVSVIVTGLVTLMASKANTAKSGPPPGCTKLTPVNDAAPDIDRVEVLMESVPDVTFSAPSDAKSLGSRGALKQLVVESQTRIQHHKIEMRFIVEFIQLLIFTTTIDQVACISSLR
jgi:hypothetical protein